MDAGFTCAESEAVGFMLEARGNFVRKSFSEEDFTLVFSASYAHAEAKGGDQSGQLTCTVVDKAVFCTSSNGLTINLDLPTGAFIASSAIGRLNGQSKPITISHGKCRTLEGGRQARPNYVE